MRIAIIGSGVYGSYASKACPGHYDVSIYERGGKAAEKILRKDCPTLTGNFNYQGYSLGRRYGLGGTSRVWGGQIFRLDSEDARFSKNRFFKELCNLGEPSSYSLQGGWRVKEGSWLYPWRKRSTPSSHSKIYLNRKVVKIYRVERKTHVVDHLGDELIYDFAILCSGVFNNLQLLGTRRYEIHDHISVPLGIIKSKDFENNLLWDMGLKHLKTKRLYYKDLDFGHYVHFVFNRDTELVEMMRSLIKGERVKPNIGRLFREIFKQLPAMLISRKFFPFDNTSVQVIADIEMRIGVFDSENNELFTSLNNDELKKNRLNLIKKLAELDLKIKWNEVDDIMKYEDIYHPYGVCVPDDLNSYFLNAEGVYRVDTGLLDSCACINPTGALFTLIDEIFRNESI